LGRFRPNVGLLVDVLVYTFSKFFAKKYDISKISTSGRNIVGVGWATMKSGCLPITGYCFHYLPPVSTTPAAILPPVPLVLLTPVANNGNNIRLQTPESELEGKNVYICVTYGDLKVPKCEIFDRSDFHYFYTIKPFWIDDFGVKILTYFFKFWGSQASFSFLCAS
jgi:hypothetical protein